MTGPYTEAARIYRDAGWLGVLPERDGEVPSGFTGYRDGRADRWPTESEVETWIRTRGADNLVLRLPRGLLGLDVDCHDGKPGAETLDVLAEDLGPLTPANWWSTARTDGSAILLYRVLEDLPDEGWQDLPGIEVIRHGHRYVRCWPTFKSEVGRPYRWHRHQDQGDGLSHPFDGVPPAELAAHPWLPEIYVDRFRRPARASSTFPSSGSGELAGARSFRALYEHALVKVESGEARHDTLLWLACQLRDNGCHRDDAGVWLTALRNEVNHLAERDISDDEVVGVLRVFDDPAREPLPGFVQLPTTSTIDVGSRLLLGGDAVLDEPERTPAVWGKDLDVLWAEGEGLMVYGPQGTGKTTIGQQLVLQRIGLRTGDFLGLPVAVDDRPVLYLALDRPRQALRSLRRMITESDRVTLNERLLIWRGPLPLNPVTDVRALAEFVTTIEPAPGTVVVDSVKDLAPGISGDEVGAALNMGWQELIARDVELLVLHHPRKAGNQQLSKDNHDRVLVLDDVYGSTWLTAGLGSVLVIDGKPGDETVTLRHIKQPAEVVGPLTVRHDRHHGVSLRHQTREVVELLKDAGDEGLTAVQVAEGAYGRTEDRDLQRARRDLKKLVESGQVTKKMGAKTAAGAQPDRWIITSIGRWSPTAGATDH